jgi:hypothetical protein
MRKWVWLSCLLAVLATADMFGSAYYVYKNPDSFLGRCALTSVVFATRFNPLVSGCKSVAADVSSLLTAKGDAVAQNATEAAERADEPAAVEEEEVVEEVPAPIEEHVQIKLPATPVVCHDPNDPDAPAWIEGFVDAGSVEPPLAAENAGAAADCKVNDAACADGHAQSGWFATVFQACLDTSKAISDNTWFTFFFGYFSSPSVLDGKGDVETSEPMDTPDNNEDPYHSYHHSECCPYTGACPYTGRMPSYAPPAEEEKPATEENTKPMKTPKKKVSNGDNTNKVEREPMRLVPMIDTMEFRDSDRSWDDYGEPFQQ